MAVGVIIFVAFILVYMVYLIVSDTGLTVHRQTHRRRWVATSPDNL